MKKLTLFDEFSYKNRKLEPWHKVKVYRNLHEDKFSIKQNGLVIGHGSNFKLKKCSFHIQPKGRERVKESGKKNVHAYIKGLLILGDFNLPNNYTEITYNPYNNKEFYRKDNGKELKTTDKTLYFTNKKCFIKV